MDPLLILITTLLAILVFTVVLYLGRRWKFAKDIASGNYRFQTWILPLSDQMLTVYIVPHADQYMITTTLGDKILANRMASFDETWRIFVH
jgi:hypothetical protein